MTKKSLFLMATLAIAITAMIPGNSDALFIATAQNFRGAIYQGIGPSPCDATEMAVARCSQNSFAPRSCRVIAVRMECPPPVCGRARKVVRKSRYSCAPGSACAPMGPSYR